MEGVLAEVFTSEGRGRGNGGKERGRGEGINGVQGCWEVRRGTVGDKVGGGRGRRGEGRKAGVLIGERGGQGGE